MNVLKTNNKKLNFKVTALLIALSTVLFGVLPTYCSTRAAFEKMIADIPFRSYRNIENKEAKDMIAFVHSGPTINMNDDLWEDLVIRGRARFIKNYDWYELVKSVFEKIDKNDLNSRRGFLIVVEKLEAKNRDAANDLRDYMRTAGIIDIKKNNNITPE